MASVVRPARAVAAALAMAAALVALVYLAFGTEWGTERPVIRNVTIGVAALLLVFGVRMNTLQRLGAVAVVSGLLAFGFGVYGGAAACVDMAYPPEAEHGITYDWSENVIRFGDHTSDLAYRCQVSPNRLLVLVGYLLTSVGAVSILEHGGIRRYIDSERER